MTEAEALHAASNATGKLDERLRTDPQAAALTTWCQVQSSLGIVAVEGMLVPEVDLLKSIDGASEPMSSKPLRTAQDVYDALALTASWEPGALETSSVAEAFRISERSNPRRSDDRSEGMIENDSAALAGTLAATTSPDPWTCAEDVRRLYVGDGFLGRSRRMALLAASPLVARGFTTQRLRQLPVASALARIDGAREAAADTDTWTPVFFQAVAMAARRSYDALVTFARLMDDADFALGRKRASSRHPEVLRCFLARPIRSVNEIADEVGLTVQGAAHLLDELVRKSVVAPLSTDKAKGRQYAMAKALAL